MWIWEKIRGVGGKREEQLAEREELGGEDPGAVEENYLAETGTAFSGGLAVQDAADVAEADLDEFKPPRDPAP
jgi:hypothetical protein